MTAVSAASARRDAAPPRLIVAGLTLAAAAVILCGCALASVMPSRAIGYGSVALACWASGMLCLAGTRRGDLGLARWRLGPWMLAWYGTASGLATLAWNGQSGITAQISPDAILRALWIVAVAVTCLVAGYAAGPGAPLRKAARRGVAAVSARRSAVVRGPLAPWLLYAAGTAARVASAATTGRVGYAGDAAAAVTTATGYGQILADVALLAPLAVCAAALRAFGERQPGARLTLAILFTAEIAYGAIAGNKSYFVTAVLAAVIPAAAARCRIPKALVIAGIAVFLAAVVPFTASYRQAARGGPVTLSASQAASDAPGILRQSAGLAAVPASAAYLLQRIQEIDAPAIITQRTPSQIPYASPVQLIEGVPAALIPRVLWPGKPLAVDGYEFSQQYYGLPASVYTSSAITPDGDLYQHGGWVPVIVGMFALGCAVRLLDDVLDVRTSPHAAFLVLLLFPALVNGEDDWVSLMAGIPVLVAVWVAAVMLAFRPWPSRGQDAA